VQVPQRLGSLLSTLPVIAGSGICYQFLTCEAYSRLLHRAMDDGILCPEDTNSSKDASLRGLRQSFWQQVVRSGLLQHLPALMDQAEKLVQTQTASSGGYSQNDAANLTSGHGRNTSTKQASSTKDEAQRGTADNSSSTSPAGSKACQLSRSGPIDGPTTPQGVLTHPAPVSLRHSFFLIILVQLLRHSAQAVGQSWLVATDVAALQLAMGCIRGWSAYIHRLRDGAGVELELAMSALSSMMGFMSATLECCQLHRSTPPLPLLLPCCVLETLVRTYSALLAAKQHLPGGLATATSTASHSHASHCSSKDNSPQASSIISSRADGGATQQPSILVGSSTKAAGNSPGCAADAGRTISSHRSTDQPSVQADTDVRAASTAQLSPLQLWHIACTQQQAIPEDHMRLLELLGVDGRTILVMAAQVAGGCDVALGVVDRLNYLRAHLSTLLGRDHSLLQPPEVALLTSAPAVLCYWMEHTNSHDKNYPTMCKLAAEVSRDMLVGAAQLAAGRAHVCCKLPARPPPALESAASTPHQAAAGARGTGSCGAMGPELQPDAGYSFMLDRVLRSVLKVLPRLDRKLLRHAGSPAGGSPGDNSSKQETLLAIERVVQLVAYMGSAGCHQASAHNHSQGQLSSAEAEAVWLRLAVPVSNVLECFVRSQAAPEGLADVASRACSAVSHTCLSSVGREGEMCCLARAMMHPGCSHHHRAQLLSLVFSLIKYCSNSRSADMTTQDASSSSSSGPAVGRSPGLLQAASDCCYADSEPRQSGIDLLIDYQRPRKRCTTSRQCNPGGLCTVSFLYSSLRKQAVA